MLKPNPQAMNFLANRRSRPGKTLVAPAPSRDALRPILDAGLRVPDHGKLEPWRLIVLGTAACVRLSETLPDIGGAEGIESEKIEKELGIWSRAPMVVAVVASPVPSEKIPAIEQVYSAGAVCLSLVNAALASGWGANWLTAWPAYSDGFSEALGLAKTESVAGFIHLGTEGKVPPERPRPGLDAKVSWVTE